MLLPFFLSCIVGFAFSADKFECSNGPPKGTFCENDLSGFVKCSVDKETGKVLSERTTCDSGKRCVCFVNTPCPESLASPCVTPHPMPLLAKSFHMDFLETIKTTSRTGDRVEKFRRVIRYDGINQRYAEKSIDLKSQKTWFTFIRKTKYGTFRRDSGTYPDQTGIGESCMNKILREFPKVFPDFSKFNRVQTSPGKEIWLWKRGARHIGESSSERRWVFKYLPISGEHVPQYLPISAEYSFRGGITAAFNQRRTKEFYLFTPDKHIGDAYFRSPEWCNPRSPTYLP